MNNKFDKIFIKSKPVTTTEILAYLNSKQTEEDKKNIELLLADNEFYADAVEGLEGLDENSRNKLIADLNKENTIIINENSSTTDWGQFAKIVVAAGIALLIGLYFLFEGNDINSSGRRYSANKPSTEIGPLPGNAIQHYEGSNDDAERDIAENPINPPSTDTDEDNENDKKETDNVVRADRSVPKAAPSFSAVDTITSYGNSREITISDNLESAFKKFRKGKYQKAALLFEKELLTDAANQQAAYYCGLSYFNLTDYKAAYIKFSGIVNTTKNNYTEDALWYKAQSLVALKDTLAAKNCLSQIVSDNGKYHADAAHLLSTLH